MTAQNPFRSNATARSQSGSKEALKKGDEAKRERPAVAGRSKGAMNVDDFSHLMKGEGAPFLLQRQTEEPQSVFADFQEGSTREEGKRKPPPAPAARRSRKSQESVPTAPVTFEEREAPSRSASLKAHKPSPPPPRRGGPRSRSQSQADEFNEVVEKRSRSASSGQQQRPPPIPKPRGSQDDERDLLADLAALQAEVEALRGSYE